MAAHRPSIGERGGRSTARSPRGEARSCASGSTSREIEHLQGQAGCGAGFQGRQYRLARQGRGNGIPDVGRGVVGRFRCGSGWPPSARQKQASRKGRVRFWLMPSPSKPSPMARRRAGTPWARRRLSSGDSLRADVQIRSWATWRACPTAGEASPLADQQFFEMESPWAKQEFGNGGGQVGADQAGQYLPDALRAAAIRRVASSARGIGGGRLTSLLGTALDHAVDLGDGGGFEYRRRSIVVAAQIGRHFGQPFADRWSPWVSRGNPKAAVAMRSSRRRAGCRRCRRSRDRQALP